jgi:hypothetical protein
MDRTIFDAIALIAIWALVIVGLWWCCRDTSDTKPTDKK